jgi:SAM-dependent methyltransferase
LSAGRPAPLPRSLAWPDLAARARDPELLDAEPPESEVAKSLRDLRLVNRCLGSRRALLRAVGSCWSPAGRLLDVGCASGDVLGYLQQRLPGVRLAVGLDIKALHLKDAAPGLRCAVGDVRRLPFAERSFDVVTASLFLHHFDAAELAPVVRELARVARRALVVCDLRRALLPYLFGRVAFPLLFATPVSVHDGLVSIRRGFREPELREAFAGAGLRQVQIRRAFPYRLLAVAPLADAPGAR